MSANPLNINPLFSQKSGLYRYSFNGKESESTSVQGAYDFGARILDARLGRWMSVDGIFFEYPSVSTFAYVNSSPIRFLDPDGNRIVDGNGKTVRLKINSEGIVEFRGKGQLDTETENQIKELAQTEIGQQLLKVANRRIRKYNIEVRNVLAVESFPYLLKSQNGGYDEMKKKGIECGDFTEGDYEDNSQYLAICGTNGGQEEIQRTDGLGTFRASKIVVNKLSVLAHFDKDAAFEAAKEIKNGIVGLDGEPKSKTITQRLLKGSYKLAKNPCWNPQYSNCDEEVSGTLVHELYEALFPKKSETDSRNMEKKFIEQKKSIDGN